MKKKTEFFKKKTGKDKIVGRPIVCNKKTLTKNGKGYAEVVLIGDVHYGSPECNFDKFQRMINYCVEKNIYILLMGDLLELATKTSIAGGWAEQQEIAQKQYEVMADALKPASNKELIIGLYTGNHEMRAYNSIGVNIMKLMCRELKVPYLGPAGWNILKVEKETYSIYGLHGSTAAQSDGTVLTAAERLSMSFYCDVFAMAHAHRCVDGISLIQQYNSRSRTITEKKKIIVVTGSYLDYGGYWQSKGGKISKTGSPKLKLMTERHKVNISW